MFKNEGGVKGRLNNVQKNRRFGSKGRPLALHDNENAPAQMMRMVLMMIIEVRDLLLHKSSVF